MKRLLKLLLLVPVIAWGKPSQVNLQLKVGEEKQIPRGPKIRFDSVGHESASSGPDSPEQVYAVFHFTLTDGGKVGKISAPVETEAAPPHVWEKYKLKVIKASADNKSVTISVF